MSAFSDFFKKAHGAIANLRGTNNLFFGKDGEIVYSKNNVCIHDLRPSELQDDGEDSSHTPGYMTIHCLNDEQSGITLVLQWLPNTTLEKNPASIRCVSPRHQKTNKRGTESVSKKPSAKAIKEQKSEEDEDTITQESCTSATTSSTDICVEMNGDMITVTSMNDSRPRTLVTTATNNNGLSEGGLFVPSINVIPHTPVDPKITEEEEQEDRNSITEEEEQEDRNSVSSATTSGADELSEKEDFVESSSCDETDDEKSVDVHNKSAMDRYRTSLFMRTPEQFAREHNLVLEADQRTLECNDTNGESAKLPMQPRTAKPSLFSVNLGKMRSMRLFYSNPECTCGQLVIASPDSQYKILHFHHGGMDKLAQLFEQWNVVKAKSVKDGSPSPVPDRHLLICHPAISKNELDPEDGLYETVSWGFWKSYMHQDGSIDDSFTIRKAIYFASMDPSLRKEIWPYLLRVYSWSLTYEQKESVRNDLFLEYQNIRKRRLKVTMSSSKGKWTSVENTIVKDVVRTDRKNPYFAGDHNPNIETMKKILLNYATVYPDINYIQGMSDLLAPLLATLRDEPDTYWCFVGLMQQTLFASAPTQENNMMDVNLEYLRELLKLLLPEFFNYLASLGGDSLQLMFVHRWILLFFKREFPEKDALHIWEACWARYRTPYFHLFVCVAIVSIYGKDAMDQKLPHDEILFYFSSLANHMDASVVLKKARGLLYQFSRLEKVPCTLAGLCEYDTSTDQWSSHVPQQSFECTRVHGDNEPCPFAANFS
uniref:Rab-GAP TBC domain-containing protein n=1 Tax=Steinernema glaseri TaxID=37863 RepID=A0A1I7ZV93_9BILA